MYNAQGTQLFQCLYKLLVAWHENCRTIPKLEKFAIGQKTENILLSLLAAITVAYQSTDRIQKKNTLLKADILLEKLKIMTRLAKDTKAIKERKYIEYQTELQEAGKMLGGWIVNLQKTIR